MDGAKLRKRFSVITDEVKLRHTTHWDLDFMTRAELEAALGNTSGADSSGTPDIAEKPDKDG